MASATDKEILQAVIDLANHAEWIHIDCDRNADTQRVTVLIGPWVYVETAPEAGEALAAVRTRWLMALEAQRGAPRAP